MTTQPFSQIGQIIELRCEYLSVQCISLYVIIMSLGSESILNNFAECQGFPWSKQAQYLKFLVLARAFEPTTI